jgi:hypothetical protein
VDALRAGVEPDNPNASRKEWHIPTRLVVRQSSAYPRGSLPALSKSSAAGRHNLMKE